MDVALGEAFINVRADLKPFAKDLERDLKKILAAAEKKVAADPNTGRQLGESLRKHTGDGVSDGIEQGYDRGSKRGQKKALSSGEKFFAALADFADDGLSAIPAKVKAGILIGVLAAAAVVAPLIAGVISAAVTTGLALGVVTLGVVFASQLKPVEDQFRALGRSLLDQLRVAATPFVEPLLRSAETISVVFSDVGDTIKRTFAQAALFVEPLTRAITGFIRELLPGIEIAVRRARPLIEALAQALPELGRDLATAFRILADGSPEAALALRDILGIIGELIIATAAFIRGLSEMWFWLRVIAASSSGDLAGAMQLIAQRETDAALASGTLTGELEDVDTALGGAAGEAYAARNAISALLKVILTSLDATIDYEEAIDNLANSIKEGNKDFNVRSDKGRDNLRLVEAAIQASARQRDAELSRAQETGRSVDDINAAYQREITTIEKVIGKNAAQSESLKQVFIDAKKLPDDVAIEVKTPGLEAALAGLRRLGQAAANAAAAGAKAILAAGGGFQSTLGSGENKNSKVKFALGGIVTQPTNALIGEAGHAEAVIPDPSVMPGRAMQLSNQFGLTSMIANALGAGQTVINVFIGQQRLEQIADYRIDMNNQMQAIAMAQGPRGV
jgi:hypothetical protein